MTPMTPLLRFSDVRVEYGDFTALAGVSFELHAGESLGLVGESGCGKSTLALAAMRCFAPGAKMSGGRITYNGRDMAGLTPQGLRCLRGSEIAMIYQDPAQALNPCLTIGEQLAESVVCHHKGDWKEGRRLAAEKLADVRFTDVERVMASYPHQLSGGQQQRCVIAMALMCNPKLLILDEPTTGLDATIETEVVELIRELQKKLGVGLLYISHNLGLIGRVCERVAVMQSGVIVEQGTVDQIFAHATHPYTRSLISCLPDVCAPSGRQLQKEPTARVLDVEHLNKTYGGRGGFLSRLFKRGRREVSANADLSVTLQQGQVLAVVGESGSGKSTFAKILMGFERADSGKLSLNGMDVARVGVLRRTQKQRRWVQMVFQSTDESLNPSYSIGRQIARAAKMGGEPSADKRREHVERLFAQTRLPLALASRRPSQLSGGQRQRAVIARAFAPNPAMVVADEPVSALDPSVQSAIADLLRNLQREHGVTMVLVSHDLGFVRHTSDQVIVMHHGQVVETGQTDAVFQSPAHPYTRRLLAAAEANRLTVPELLHAEIA